MLRYLNKIHLYHNYFIYFVILFFFWASINTGSKYLLTDFGENNDFGTLLNFLRSIVPYIFCFFFILFVKPNLKKIFEINIILLLFFFYGLTQLSGLFYIGENLHEHYWVICLFSLLLFFNFIQKKNDKEILNFVFLTNNFILFIIFALSIFLIFKDNIFTQNLPYTSYAFTQNYNYEQMPRSTGVSRMAFLLFIFFNCFYFSKNISKRIKILILIINIILISIILLLQSRGIILSLTLGLILINYLYREHNLNIRFKYFSLIIFIPIIVFILYPSFKNIIIEKYGYKVKSYKNYNQYKIKNLEINLRGDLFNTIDGDTLDNNIARVSNNRTHAWKFLILVFFKKELDEKLKKAVKEQRFKLDAFNFKKKYNFLTGYGPQADRYFMYNTENRKGISNVTLGPFGAHSSNGYLYSLICSGILGFFIFLILNLIIFYKIIKIIFLNKSSYFILNTHVTASIIIILFLQFRVLFENSFSVFGVDMLFLLSSYLIIEKAFRNLKN